MIIPKSYLLILISLCFLSPFPVSAGVIRKPPNNLGLIAYWPMDEGAGTVVTDHSGNGRNGTFAGSLTFLPGWDNGKFGKALNFTGTGPSDGRIGITALNVTNTHTVSMWVYISSNCSTWGALFAANAVDGLYCLVSGGNNRISYFYSAGDHFSNTNISLNQWHHVAVTNNGGSATFYLDGVADGTAASAPAYSATVIGNDSSNEDFPGRIDDLRVYNRVLSASEVLALYQSGFAKIGISNLSPGTLKNGLTGHWTFDGKDMVSNVADVSGNGGNGYLTNFTSTTTTLGKIGQALTFDGSNDFVNTNSSVSNFITASEGTISAWVRPTNTAPNISAISVVQNARTAVSSSGLQEFGIFQANITGLGEDRIWVYNTTSSYVGIPYNVGEWIHVTWVHSGGVLYAYTNGELEDSVASAIGTSLLSNLWIGNNWGFGAGTRFWRGDLDDVRTWNRALTASEIKQVYNIGAGQKVSTTKTPVGTLKNGLTGHWTFDGKDMVSNVADVSGNGNNGTLTGFTSTTTAIGKIGQALAFNLNKSVSIPDNTSLNMTSAMSVAGWVFPIDITASSYPSLVDKNRNSQWAFILDYADAGSFLNQIRAIVYIAGARRDCTATSNLVNNQWQHIAFTYNGNEIIIYKDGVSLSAAGCTWAGSIGTSSSSLSIGKLSGFAGFIGSIDDVRIYNRALSVSEVKQLYNLGK